MLLERIAEERLGGDGARRAVLYLAFFPTALFLQAVYSESLFLFLCLGAFLLAERGRIREAGVVVGLALLTRPTAVALVPAAHADRATPLVAARDGAAGRRRVPAAPVVEARRPVGVRARGGDVAPASVAGRDPLGGIWDGAARRLGGHRANRVRVERTRLLDGGRARGLDSAAHRRRSIFCCSASSPSSSRSPSIAWREFGAPYGLFAALSLALPLSVPSSRWPLLSLPRFGLVVFPFFLALAWIGGRNPRANAAILGFSALLLGVFVTQWALWDWVA